MIPSSTSAREGPSLEKSRVSGSGADVDGDVVGSDWERDTMDSRVHVG